MQKCVQNILIDIPTCSQSVSLSHCQYLALPLVSGTDYIGSLNSYSSASSTSDEQALNKIVLLVNHRDLTMVNVPDADQSPKAWLSSEEQTRSSENTFLNPLSVVDTHVNRKLGELFGQAFVPVPEYNSAANEEKKNIPIFKNA